MAITAELRAQIGEVAPVVLAAEQVLPVPSIFSSVIPGGGLQRGSTVGVGGGPAGRVVAWSLLGAVTGTGGWVASVGMAGVGLVAAHEVGVAIERVLVVDTTDVDAETWSASIGALIGAVDVVMFGTPRHRITPSEQRRMSSRARERGTVLLEVPGVRPQRQLAADLTLDVEAVRWDGLENGHGVIRSRIVDVVGSGRRGARRERRATLALPSDSGALDVVAESTPSTESSTNHLSLVSPT